jgi:Flp pilus assembly CpaF family ATPase
MAATLWDKLGGANYLVPASTPPKEALAEAVERSGADWQTLARHGWAGPLHQLIHSHKVRDIIVQHPGQVWVRDARGRKSREAVHMSEAWIRFLPRLWHNAANGQGSEQDSPLDPYNVTRKTLLFADNSGGMRYVYSPAAFSSWGPSLYIRRLPSRPVVLSEMVRNGSLPQAAAELLVAFLAVGTPVVVSGQTGAGKTTLLAALVHELQRLADPLNLLIVERTHEIPVTQPAYRWEQDAAGRVSLDHLAEKATQMGLEWLVLGECTGPEAYFVAKAFSQGVPAMTTLHASSATAAIKKLAMLSLEYLQDPRLLPVILSDLADQGLVSVHLSLKEREPFGLLGAVTGIVETIGVSGESDPVVNPLWEWKDGAGGLVWNSGSLSQLSEATAKRFLAAGMTFPVPTPAAAGDSAARGSRFWRK